MAVATIDTSVKRHLGRRYIGIAVFLMLMLPLTLGLRTWRIASLRADATKHQAEAVTEAIGAIEQHFATLQAESMTLARELATAPEVASAMREIEQGGSEEALERLISLAESVEIPERTAVEFYNRVPRVVAWKGFSMPLDSAPDRLRFLETYQAAIARDGEDRQALATWWPVRDVGRVVGAVRVMRLTNVHTPIQNRYLRDYSLEEEWQDATGLAVQVDWEGGSADVPLAEGHTRVIQGADGTILGRLFIQPPSIEDLVANARTRFNDVLAFWMMLFLFWLIAGLWVWYRSAEEVMAAAPVSYRQVVLRFFLLGAAWWGTRFVLLQADVPARWQGAKAPLAPLFDPAHLASNIGAGLLRSTGDLLITAIFSLIFGIAVLDFATHLWKRNREAFTRHLHSLKTRSPGAPLRLLGIGAAATLLVFGLTFLLAAVTRRVVLDSTIDYYSRTGLIPDQPERLILVVFCSLLLLTVATVAVSVAILWPAIPLFAKQRPARWSLWAAAALYTGIAAVVLVVLYAVLPLDVTLPWPVALVFLFACVSLALTGHAQRYAGLELLTLRGILLAVFLVSLLLYPMFFGGMDARRRIQMVEASDTFGERRDPRVIFAIEQVLDQARSGSVAETLRELLRSSPGTGDTQRPRFDSLAGELLSASFLASLGPYDVSFSVLDTTGHPVGRHYEAEKVPGASAALDQIDSTEFDILQDMYAEDGSGGIMVEQITGRLQRDRFQYVGIAPIVEEDSERRLGWVMARAESQTLLQYNEAPFPRVLLPAGYLGTMRQNLSLANFRNGVLVRSLGRDFGRYALDEEVRAALVTTSELWNVERVEGRRYLTYYRSEEPGYAPMLRPDVAPPVASSVVAVRVPAVNAFDHLYYLLRFTIAGLFIGIPIYVAGLYVRWRAGLFPSPRVRFRDKVLNSFLAVGIISVGAVGFVGQQVVTEETEGAVRAYLRQHLERVEDILALEAQGNEMPYRVLSRTHVDSLAALAGLDLNLYRQGRLVETTRPQFVRDRLIDQRMPIEAYRALYLEGYRTTFADEQIGSFRYKAGYHALLDESGEPQYVISVPTLPEQERIEEERARTIAYLFGALLLLVLAVMLTASLISDALARPIGRLRIGLKAVAKGQFERAIPVTSRDEIGDLVRTFNEMQEQLAESRRKLATQERQLAWREMARQVAHEIKNPLTPMKLSVQHLRRAYDNLGDGAAVAPDDQASRFASLFDRITTTLIEQIDTLARIANEFHTFARMPTRMLERLDLNAVVQEAVSLMQEESNAEIDLNLSREPLIVQADREELRRVYINLIKNAIQAIPEEREGQVTVTTSFVDGTNGTAGWASSTVVDNGTGIPAELREKIFEPNFSTKTSGTGLGLAITRKSIEELHGEIGFETEEEAGTTFWIRLPLAEN